MQTDGVVGGVRVGIAERGALVKHHVSAVFHGHDHMFVHAERDGLTYQCVAQPGNPRGNVRSASDYGYRSGTILPSPGFVRVSVTPASAVVAWVPTSAEAGDGTPAPAAHEYRFAPVVPGAAVVK